MKDLSRHVLPFGHRRPTVKEVRKLLPREHIVYLGDTARAALRATGRPLPSYVLENARFLLSRGRTRDRRLQQVERHSAACAQKTASCQVPVVGVIEPPSRRSRLPGPKGSVYRNEGEEPRLRKHDRAPRPLGAGYLQGHALFWSFVEEGFKEDEIAKLTCVETYLAICPAHRRPRYGLTIITRSRSYPQPPRQWAST